MDVVVKGCIFACLRRVVEEDRIRKAVSLSNATLSQFQEEILSVQSPHQGRTSFHKTPKIHESRKQSPQAATVCVHASAVGVREATVSLQRAMGGAQSRRVSVSAAPGGVQVWV